jgi:hypothetical protein
MRDHDRQREQNRAKANRHVVPPSSLPVQR